MFYKQKLIKEIIEYGKLCGEKNFTPGYSGNISARYKQGMLITTSGSSNGYLKQKEIVYTDFEGNSLEKERNLPVKNFCILKFIKKDLR